MPTLPVHQLVASTVSSPSIVVKPLARPLSQSITAFGASDSLSPPTVGQPCDAPVPGDSECTTAKPRGTQKPMSELAIRLRRPWWRTSGMSLRFGGSSPTSCLGFQKYFGLVVPMPE